MCGGSLVAAEFLAGTIGIGFVENVANKYFQYDVIWITIFIMGLLGLLFDITLRKIIDKETINNKNTFPVLSIPKTEIIRGAQASGGTGL